MTTPATAPHPDTSQPAGDAPDPALISLTEQLHATRTELAEARTALDAAERRRALDAALIEADAIDLETARLLTERIIEHLEVPDLHTAVRDLKKRKPFLFRSPAAAPGAAMSAHPRTDGAASSLDSAAAHAAQTGSRAALLHYLRARRQLA